MTTVLVNAASARAGGGLRFAEELVPRLAAALADQGVRTERIDASKIGARGALTRRIAVEVSGRRLSRGADLVLNLGNSALSGCRPPQWVMVRNRLLVDRPAGTPWGPTGRLREAALLHGLVQSERWIVPSNAMAGLVHR